ncbi:thermonuclease family protein [Metamycoplasma neophronis]|uniref:Thermonuclease family protein n=1 Tax=Metamycoplasma neophronis TaxID=872983 RepID=A0ABY2Z0I7_9BACT|nr:thermonuclease family protein [Metamycoplasma neophronis]TPR54660.1 thermonuclease family protein [Metamycoplasma neophronis]
MKHKKIFLALASALSITSLPIVSVACLNKSKNEPNRKEYDESHNQSNDASNLVINGHKITQPDESSSKILKELYNGITTLYYSYSNIIYAPSIEKNLENLLNNSITIYEQNAEDELLQNQLNKINKTLDSSYGIKPIDFEKYQQSSEDEIGKLTKVNILKIRDGDTFSADNGKTYRFSGIDTPETHKKEPNGEWIDTTGSQYKYGKLAEKFTTDILQNAKEVYVMPQKTISPSNDETHQYWDRYKRIVAIIYYRNKNNNKVYCLNEQIVYFGKARMGYISLNKKSNFFTSNKDYYHELAKASDFAQFNKLGIYSDDVDYNEIYPPRS